MKSYKEIIAEINRNRTIKHFAHLTGTYNTLCEVSTTFKENGKYRLTKPQEHTFYMASVVPEVEKFCGKWFTESVNPDALPHPIRIAMEWHNGVKVRDVIMQNFPNLARMLPMVHDRCERLGIKLNVPSTEWEDL